MNASPFPPVAVTRFTYRMAVLLACLSGGLLFGQEPASDASEKAARTASTEESDEADAAVAYPISVSTTGVDQPIFVVDLELPGVWKLSPNGEDLAVFHRGSKRFRQPMNRPRCVLALEDGTILVGDSATREVYLIDAAQADPQPLTAGSVGIPMCLAIDPAGEMVYVGDAERRTVFRFPIDGGEPKVAGNVNARGLSFDANGGLWALTPDDPAVVKLAEDGTVTPVVSGRPFQYASDLVCAGDQVFVSDGYGKAIFTVSEEGNATKWFEGEPLIHPVGLSATANALLVADPHSKQVYRIEWEGQQAQPMLPNRDE